MAVKLAAYSAWSAANSVSAVTGSSRVSKTRAITRGSPGLNTFARMAISP
jgi:hypothetical protein